jgi:DNA-binding protein HU-beta
MTKIDLATKISKKTGFDLYGSKANVEAFMEVVKESLKAGDPVFLRGFGTFSAKQRAAKTARNISKGTSVVIPAHKVPHFKPCKEFKESLS